MFIIIVLALSRGNCIRGRGKYASRIPEYGGLKIAASVITRKTKESVLLLANKNGLLGWAYDDSRG